MILALILSLITTSFAWGEVYYVDPKNSVASDLNLGTLNLPWKTIQKAAEVAVAGDTVYVKNSIYRERIEVKNSGTSYERMITFQALGNNVIIKGSDMVTNWTLWKDKIWKRENWPVNSQQVFIDGIPLDQIGGNRWFSPHRLPAKGKGVDDLTSGSFYYDEQKKILYVRLKDGGNPNHHVVEASVRPLLFLLRDKNFIKLSGFKFMHSNTIAFIKTGWPCVSISGNNCIIENNEVSWCDFGGLGATGNSLIVRNNVSNYNGNSGMGFSGHNIQLESNVTNYNNYRGFNMNWHAGGIKSVQLKNSVINHHTAVGNNGPGIWCDGDCDDVTISAARVYGNSGNGIFYEISKRGLIINNIVYENAGNGIYISASESCKVFNNLLYANKRGLVLHGVPRKGHVLKNNLAENNILVDNIEVDIVVARLVPEVVDNRTDYNLFYQRRGKLQLKFGHDQIYQSLDNWVSRTGYDTHSVIEDPKFVDVEKHDFHLVIGSPAIGKGNPNSLVQEDFDGVSRDSTKEDIGPYKFKLNRAQQQ